MPDRNERLRTTLAELEAELHRLPAVDVETRAILEEAVAEITSVLQRGVASSAVAGVPTAGGAASQPHDDSRWREAVADFEVSHPHLAGLLSRVINALAQIGI